MKIRIATGLLSVLLPLTLLGQVPIEAGAFIGTTTYQGDLAENHVEFNELNLAYGGFVRYAINPKVKLRGNVIYGNISGTDRNAKDLGLYNRGWTYDSYIVEMSLLMEYHPIGRSRTDKIGFFAPQVTPYIASGVGFINFDPSITVSRFQDVNLFPENAAKSSSVSMPVIGGVTFDISEKFLLGVEVGSRLTFNDYLDGVSKNGNPKKGDLFIFGGVCLTYYVGYESEYSF
ncbi:MAG: hypothetical protein RLY31_3099 [Bacteroidota bacterium]|jgi:hypothetical protein